MNTKALVTMLLLLLCAMIFASEDAGDAAEHARKTQELNQLAERFKAETGFEGDISFSQNYTKMTKVRGTFRDIRMNTLQDSLLTERIIDLVMQKMNPFITAREGQLSPMELESTQNNASKKWVQTVNGYKVHPGGYFKISYNKPSNEFIVIDATADISNDPVPINISKEDAKQLLIKEYRKSEYNDDARHYSQDPSIGYFMIPTSKYPLQFRLYWTMMFWGVSFSIDVESLEVVQTMTSFEYINYTVKGKTFRPIASGLEFPPTTPPESPMIGIRVDNGSEGGLTDQNGLIELSLTPQDNYAVSMKSDRWEIQSIQSFGNTLDVHNYTGTDTEGYKTIIEDEIDNDFVTGDWDPSMYSANIYYYLQKQDEVFRSISPNFSPDNDPVQYPLIINDDHTVQAIDCGGVFQIDHNTGELRIHFVNGSNPYIIMHELSHFFAYNQMENKTFSPLHSQDAMDEAFAEYFVGRGLELLPFNRYIRNYDGEPIDIYSMTVEVVNGDSDYNSDGLLLNEDFYSWYYCGMSIAGAWEYIEVLMLSDNFDTELIAALGQVDENDTDYYKPRYFYNILMRNATPDNKVLITDGYEAFGFHFTPQVISAGSLNSATEKNMFRIGDPVYVTITNCPQNTPVTVYIVADQDYTDGMGVSALNTIVHQFSATTDSQGKVELTEPVLTAPAVGAYDIIVNIGNDNSLHYAYLNANVRDGFDGLNGPGFTVYYDGIDVVVASRHSK